MKSAYCEVGPVGLIANGLFFEQWSPVPRLASFVWCIEQFFDGGCHLFHHL